LASPPCRSGAGTEAPSWPRLFAPLLVVLLPTGQRRNEVAGMRRGELSDDGATWNIPGSRTKNGHAHIVPLSPLVRELIASVKAKPDSPFIFTTTGATPLSGWSRMKGRLDPALAVAREEGRAIIPPWTLHDLRGRPSPAWSSGCRRTSSRLPSITSAARVVASPAPTTAASLWMSARRRHDRPDGQVLPGGGCFVRRSGRRCAVSLHKGN
jgi:hypothetical protein